MVSYLNLNDLLVIISGWFQVAEVEALSRCIAYSPNLETIEILGQLNLHVFTADLEYWTLMEAALSCSTLKTFETSIPFTAFSGAASSQLERVCINVDGF